MPIDPISWMIISFIAGAATGATVAYFWDSIKAWATRVVGYIIDTINRAIEVASKAIIYLEKRGARIYKRAEVYVRNIFNGNTSMRYKEEEIPRYDVPDDINADLENQIKMKVMQQG